MKHVLTVLIVVLATSSAVHVAHADARECREDVDHYNSVLGDVTDSLKRYANCVASSRGHDDCSTEFRHLKNDQGDFESAWVSIRADAATAGGDTRVRHTPPRRTTYIGFRPSNKSGSSMA